MSGERQRIVEEARRWIGTPYQSQAYPRRGVGCDCASFIAGVAMGAGLIPPETPIPYYSPERHLHRSDEEYRRRLAALGFDEIRPAAALAGDVILFVMGSRQPASHSAVISTGGKGETSFAPYGRIIIRPFAPSFAQAMRMVHAYRAVGRVVENRIDPTWWARARFAFRFPGVTDVG